jgi:hypothetical protein
LGDHIREELSPRELAEDAVGESDSRVQVSAGYTTRIDSKHDAETFRKLVRFQV